MTAKKKAKKKKTAEEIIGGQEGMMPIIPDRPSEGIIHDAKSVIEKKDPKSELQAKVLLDMANSDGWKIFKQYLQRRNARLLSLTRESNRKRGFNFADAGYAFTLYDQISAADDAAISFVEGPTKLKAFDKEDPDDADAANEE